MPHPNMPLHFRHNSRRHDAADLALLDEGLGVVAVGEDGGADERREHHVLAEKGNTIHKLRHAREG